ncbi:hypothetical protein [Xenorhabdus bovienii]|uniref:hypothetical protein n=1 Tax=Xenorhabdus bovienii TaxID=40576 RepID=UPI0004D34421|nr:hypothetical protein [Xenorhabdus bovienii]CDG90617.1 hypothetical protein XBFFR1_970029 [Xenorhabdus bovienii str. feltiae France]CDG90689.1 hypothetical protein XBFFL1_1040021 [Xenorhabdus bovienii str. feltiae Florida]
MSKFLEPKAAGLYRTVVNSPTPKVRRASAVTTAPRIKGEDGVRINAKRRNGLTAKAADGRSLSHIYSVSFGQEKRYTEFFGTLEKARKRFSFLHTTLDQNKKEMNLTFHRCQVHMPDHMHFEHQKNLVRFLNSDQTVYVENVEMIDRAYAQPPSCGGFS